MKNQKHPFLTFAHTIDPEKAMDCLENNFGFDVDGDFMEDGILLDEDGDPFYDLPERRGIDFTTLEGFMNYAYLLGRQDGVWETQHEIKRALGL